MVASVKCIPDWIRLIVAQPQDIPENPKINMEGSLTT
jgi:hypothetical protein